VPSQLKSIVLRAPGKAGLNFEGESMQASPSYADVANNIAYDFAGRLANRKGWEASTTLANHLGKQTLGSAPFTPETTAGLQGRVKVTDSSHGAISGDFVTFTGADESVSGITAAQLNTRFSLTKIDGNNYYVYTDGTGENTTAAGGGSVVDYYEPQINTLFTYNYNDAALLIASAIVRGVGKLYDHPVGSAAAAFTDRSGGAELQTLSTTDAKWQFNNYKSVSTVVCIGTNTDNAKVPIVKTGAGNWAGVLPMPERLVYSSSLDSQAADAANIVSVTTTAEPSVSSVFTTGRIITVTTNGNEGDRRIRITGKDAAGAALVARKALGTSSLTAYILTSDDIVAASTDSQTTGLYFKTITAVKIETSEGDTTATTTAANYSVGVAVGTIEVAGLSNLAVASAPTDVPTGGISHSAFGRLWIQKEATGINQNVIVYSGANNYQQWYVGVSAANAGELDLAANFSAWKNGYDELVALSSFDKFLVAFMRNSIIVYESPDDVANIKINMALQGVGCLSKDSIQSVGNDLYFLSATGIRSLRQVLQSGDKVELSDISVLVRRALMEDVASAETVLPSVRSNYDPEEGQYWLKSAGGTIWVFDLASLNPNIPTRITKYVDTDWFSFCYHEGDSYLGYQGRVGKYNNYLDNGAAYECEWLSNPFDLDTSSLKVLKKLGVTIEGQSTDKVTVTTQFAEGGYSGLTMLLSEGLSDSRSAAGVKAEWSSRYSNGYLLCGVDLTDIQYPYVLPHDAPFKITVNGTTSGTLNLPDATYNTKGEIATAVAAAINNDSALGTNNVTVTVDSPTTVDYQPWNIGSRLRITSTSTATTSAVTIPSGDTTTTAVTGTGGHKVIPYVSRIFDGLVGLTNTLYDTDNGATTVSTIGAELASGASTCALSADDEDAKLRMTGDMAVSLANNSGTIRIGTETIRYNGISAASPPSLTNLTRGVNAATIVDSACVEDSSTVTITARELGAGLAVSNYAITDTNTTVTVTCAAHIFNVGDTVRIEGVDTSLGGNITAAVLNGDHVIISSEDTTHFAFTASATASGSDTSGHGGNSSTVHRATNFKIGDLITIAGATDGLGNLMLGAVLNQTHAITAMSSPTTFTFTAINSSGAVVTASGTNSSDNLGGSATINAAATHAEGSEYHLVNEAGDFTNEHAVIARDAGIARVATEGQDFSTSSRQATDTNEGEWGGGSVNVVNLNHSASGAGRSLRVGVRFNSNGYKVALDQVSLFLKLGREGR
jgi:hypothetical protein